ncbi:MAG: recombinase family protein [Brevinema sp.]
MDREIKVRNADGSTSMSYLHKQHPVVRAAVYTRKSSEEGLELEYNSLDAQRDSCRAYIQSQKHEGWELVDREYSDGGISGGTLNRPALQELLQDIKNGLVDIIVVYKIDRLTRSPAVQPSIVPKA